MSIQGFTIDHILTAFTEILAADCYRPANERQNLHFTICAAVFRRWRMDAVVRQYHICRRLADE